MLYAPIEGTSGIKRLIQMLQVCDPQHAEQSCDNYL